VVLPQIPFVFYRHFLYNEKKPNERRDGVDMENNAVCKLWEVLELVLYAERDYQNPYMEVDVWIDLKGPGFEKRVYGFWDGENRFRIRFTATASGKWGYRSGSNQPDDGLCGKAGSFFAEDWSEEEKQENPSRRGLLRPDANGHSFVHADGTSFFMIGDTWWATPTFRYRWSDDDVPHPLEEGYFKDLVQFRKRQGYNAIGMLTGHPTWANDGYPTTIEMEPGVWVRNAWKQAGTDSAKDMHNSGGRPFCFPGTVKGYENLIPDFSRINPAYFEEMDRKIDYLHQNGMISFIEIARRDVSTCWAKYGGWPDTYARYIQYVFARYQAHFCLFSPIHFDWEQYSVPAKAYNEPINLWLEQYGAPPFGTLCGTNAAPSTLVNFGGPEEAPWLTFHQTGNWREHDHHWYLTELYHSKPFMPAIAGEPYYPGYPNDTPKTDSLEAERNNRAGIYGSFLSGALGGTLYGVEGVWGGDVEAEAPYRLGVSIQYRSGAQTPFLRDFAMSEGDRYRDLIPNSEWVTPNKMGEPIGYRGWAYCAATPEKDYALFYLEPECPAVSLRGFPPETVYRVSSFDPTTGEWSEAGELWTDSVGRAPLTEEKRTEDIGYKLIKIGEDHTQRPTYRTIVDYL